MEKHTESIDRIRQEMGDSLHILAHHYQGDEVVRHADSVGDSLELARKVPELDADSIVMCGVYFMAETASVLAGQGQQVVIPDPGAGCTLSDLAPARLVEACLRDLNRSRSVVPLAYVNTSAAVKAVCGRYGGAVCTSANAATMLEWALSRGDGVLFLPDKNLAENSADQLRLSGDRRNYGLNAEQAPPGTVFIWPGICDVHTAFRAEQIRAVRESDPEARVILHPECPPELVELADACGSTSQIIGYVRDCPPGSRIYVGTEINLVRRLQRRFAGQKEVLVLQSCDCPHMARITEERLAALLKDLQQGRAGHVDVDGSLVSWAREAVNRMLQVCS